MRPLRILLPPVPGEVNQCETLPDPKQDIVTIVAPCNRRNVLFAEKHVPWRYLSPQLRNQAGTISDDNGPGRSEL